MLCYTSNAAPRRVLSAPRGWSYGLNRIRKLLFVQVISRRIGKATAVDLGGLGLSLDRASGLADNQDFWFRVCHLFSPPFRFRFTYFAEEIVLGSHFWQERSLEDSFRSEDGVRYGVQ